jgi:hypothetical protein
MPKGRYDIMRAYMPKRGGLGLDMMLRTCTVQANLDFADEADMVTKFRVSLALQPVATALFANSPFVEGKPSGFLSTRANVWTDTDPDRTGMLDLVFADGFGFEAYAEYALDVPMYFAKRGGRYLDLSGRSFRAFMKGELSELPGERPDAQGLAGPPHHHLPRGAAQDLPGDARRRRRPLEPHLRPAGAVDRRALRRRGARRRLGALQGTGRRRIACGSAGRRAPGAEDRSRRPSAAARSRATVGIARGGLRRRQRLSGGMVDETGYLRDLEEIADSGVTPPSACSISTTAAGTATSAASSTSSPTDGGEGRIFVGVGGWTYEPWRGVFYPKGCRRRRSWSSPAASSPPSRSTAPSTAPSRRTASASGATRRRRLHVHRQGPPLLHHAQDGRRDEDSIEWFLNSGVTELGRQAGADQLAVRPHRAASTPSTSTPSWASCRTSGTAGDSATPWRCATRASTAEFVDLLRRHDAGGGVHRRRGLAHHPRPTSDFIYARLQRTKEEVETGYTAEELDFGASAMKAGPRAAGPEPLPPLSPQPGPRAAPRRVRVHDQRGQGARAGRRPGDDRTGGPPA